jgi:hypothetical protein
MISLLTSSLFLAIDLKIDQKFEYETEWIPFEGNPIKLPWKLTVKAADKKMFFLDLQQGAGQPVQLILSRENAVLTRPPTASGLPTKIWRIIEGLLPAKTGQPYRNKSWSVDFYSLNDTEGDAVLEVTFRRPKTIFSYREGTDTRAMGECLLDRKFPLPPYLRIEFFRGTTFVLKKIGEKKEKQPELKKSDG